MFVFRALGGLKIKLKEEKGRREEEKEGRDRPE